VSVRPELLGRMLQINGFVFAGANLTIEAIGKSPDQSTSSHTEDTKARITVFLASRFLKEAKILNLSGLANDPVLTEMGLFGNTSTESKFIPAVMKVWEMNFGTPQEGRRAVESISLANNNLANISLVTSLSQTFPDLKNLDLSNNTFKDAQSLVGWRWKFRKLEFLDLTGSPFSSDPGFKDTMLKWYPRLKTLNNMQVRTDEEILSQQKAPIPVQPAYFQDDSQIAENFVKAFFANYDNDRDSLLSMVYDQHSTFSLNVNPLAPRGTQQDHTAGWDQYIKKSRNLLKISHLPARMSRTYTGIDKIRELWNTLPKTKHPDLTLHPEEWLIECHPTPGLPDPADQIPGGVGGLVITIHGKFEEAGGSQVETRSFDRTFILGPGAVPGGIRVLNDMLTLRAYGGREAWSTGSQAVPSTNAKSPTAASSKTPKHPQTPGGYGLTVPGKTDTQVQQEQMVLQLSFKTSMTLQYSEMALTGNNWNLNLALKNFEELKVFFFLVRMGIFYPSKLTF
jgi:nuclear RNA export factor